jgi:guanosine-3',5'-bis(diphosphate) 3'-pyrophosphohydrolase
MPFTVNLQEALQFAVERHSGQWREGDAQRSKLEGDQSYPLPYAFHPMEVTLYLRHLGGVTDSEMLAAALLHDTLEESITTEEELRQRFGNRVAGLVRELTRHEPGSAELAGLSKVEIWELRSSILLAEIAEMTPEAMAIKLADRLSNYREALYSKTPPKLERYRKQTEEILRIVPRGTNPSIWDEIRRALG